MTRTDTKTLIAALRTLSQTIQTDDGVANTAIAEAADRLEELHEQAAMATDTATELPQEAAHTPGPWRFYQWARHHERAGYPSSVGQDNELGMEADDVCVFPDDCTAVDKATALANARLIAAAPEMLEALRDCLSDYCEPSEMMHGRCFSTGNIVRDAIEKATGVRPAEVV